MRKICLHFSQFRISFDLRSVTSVVLAITIFWSIDPFFAWASFAGGIGVMLFKALQILAMLLMACQLPWRKMPVSKLFAAMAVLGIFLFYCFFTGTVSGTTHPFVIGNVLIFLFYALTVMTDRDILVSSFKILRTIFSVTLGYTLVIYLLLLLQVPIPYEVLQSGETGRQQAGMQFYHNYLGCILINGNGKLLYRFTSAFTEPGVVGTFCAFFLAADNLELKKNKQNLLFLISGILSFSVAFYLLTITVYILKTLREKGYKRLVGLVALVVAYFVFININFTSPELADIQERLTFTETGLMGDNRMDEIAEEEYQRFLNSDMKTVLLGYGYPKGDKETQAAWQMSTSYKESIYCLGVLGYGLMLAWFVLTPIVCYKTNERNKNAFMYVYLAVFIASQYQRPYMKALFLAYILLAGCLYARECTGEDKSVPYLTRKPAGI